MRILRKGKKVRQDLRNRSETDRESPHVELVWIIQSRCFLVGGIFQGRVDNYFRAFSPTPSFGLGPNLPTWEHPHEPKTLR